MAINTLQDVEPGQLYTMNGKDVWRLESFCHHPTVTLRNLESGETKSMAVGSGIAMEFERLLPEGGP